MRLTGSKADAQEKLRETMKCIRGTETSARERKKRERMKVSALSSSTFFASSPCRLPAHRGVSESTTGTNCRPLLLIATAALPLARGEKRCGKGRGQRGCRGGRGHKEAEHTHSRAHTDTHKHTHTEEESVDASERRVSKAKEIGRERGQLELFSHPPTVNCCTSQPAQIHTQIHRYTHTHTHTHTHFRILLRQLAIGRHVKQRHFLQSDTLWVRQLPLSLSLFSPPLCRPHASLAFSVSRCGFLYSVTGLSLDQLCRLESLSL